MARAPKKEAEATHTRYSIDGVKVSSNDLAADGDDVVVIVPKGMAYTKVRKALEIALLRIR